MSSVRTLGAADEVAVYIAYSLDNPITDHPIALTVGKFDGIHLGHQRMITTIIERARSQGFKSAVLTFDPHPKQVLRPQEDLRLLTSLEERIRLIAAHGTDYLIIAPFTQETVNTPAYDYMRQICAVLPLRELWVGPGFALGRRREGTIARLTEIGAEMGYTVGTVEPVMFQGGQVSSSRVRQMLREGDVATVQHLLGRHFVLHGIVVEGDKRGRTLGFPTANLSLAPIQALPADGVYACFAHVYEQRIPAVTNIGMRPTFGELRHLVETHLLDWSGNLYGLPIQVEFLHYLRGEHKFAGVDELVAQIGRDAEQARTLLQP